MQSSKSINLFQGSNQNGSTTAISPAFGRSATKLAPVVHLTDFTPYARILKYKKGDFIYSSRDLTNSIYLIQSGRIKVATTSDGIKEITKNIFSADEVFGELAILGNQKRNEYAIALESSQIYVFDIATINRLLKNHPSLYNYFTLLIGSRAIQAERRLEALVFLESRTRIINYLLELASTKGKRVGFETLIPQFMTHQEVANLTSTSRQTVTTLLNDLRNDNIIIFNRRRLLIRDLDRLTQAKEITKK